MSLLNVLPLVRSDQPLEDEKRSNRRRTGAESNSFTFQYGGQIDVLLATCVVLVFIVYICIQIIHTVSEDDL